VICISGLADSRGLNDGAPGALLPSLEKYYNLNYAVVSLIFLSNACGFLAASFLSNKLHVAVGRCKSLVIGTALQTLCYVILSTHPPYGAVIFGFLVAGAGMGFILAHANSYMVRLSMCNLTQGNASKRC
jgi:fucose permease